MKLIAFAASNSQNSINKMLASYAASLIPNAECEILDLNDYEMPLFSVDREKDIGQHPLAQSFLDKINSADALIISFAEHNGNYSAAYKNLFDWCSRIRGDVYQDKPTVLLSTSPGKRGGQSVLNIAKDQLPRFGAQVLASFSLPSFNDHFNQDQETLNDGPFKDQLKDTLQNAFSSSA